MTTFVMTTKAPLPRSDLAAFLPTHRAIRAFEDAQGDAVTAGQFITAARAVRVLTVTASDTFPAGAVLAAGTGLAATDGGATFTLKLADTAVAPGTYGNGGAWPRFTVDQQGRIIAAASLAFSVTAPLFYDPVARVFALTPVPAALAGVPVGGAVGAVLTKTAAADYTAAWTAQTRELRCSAEAPIASSQVVLRYAAAVAVTLPVDLAGWIAAVATRPAATFVLTLRKNGAAVGTITIPNGGAVVYSTTGVAVPFAVGDMLTISAPAAADASIAGLAITGLALL